MKSFRHFQKLQNTITHAETNMFKHKNDGKSYEAAIDALNGLQSNASYLKIHYNQKLSHTVEYSRTILQVEKYLSRIGVSIDQLNNLSVIHVAGTKGKGSTCAHCESILRHHGYKTGFYSSPHLLEVKERIRINGQPISQNTFANHFWNVYDKLQEKKNDVSDMPLYFRFLTVLAFYIFLNEQVDVAVVEVGIGGEFDCTNVLRKVPVVGITSLGTDHTQILGNTLEEIAWHKAGIMKKGAKAFTVSQPISALKVLKRRSIEKKCTLSVINNIVSLEKDSRYIPESSNINASLAVTLAHSWMTKQGVIISLDDFIKAPATQSGLKNLTWPGRYHIVHTNNINYYLDGAHTPESMDICVKWYSAETMYSTRKKVLIFNNTGDRDFIPLLSVLQACNFDEVYFVPNISGRYSSADNRINESSQMVRCNKHKDAWHSLCRAKQNYLKVVVLSSVANALEHMNNNNYDLLVTGSLHLIGAVLSIVDPELKSCQNIENNGSLKSKRT